MKRSLKIALIIFGILLIIILLISLLISPVAKRYIEKNSKQLTGRVVIMDKLRFNMFAGSLKVTGFEMKEQNDQDVFFKFDTLAVKVKLLDLLFHKITVNKIHLTESYLHLSQKGTVFNFDDLIKKFQSTDTSQVADKPSKPWEVGLYDIFLKKGNVLYQDLIIGGKWDLRDLNLKIPDVYFSDKATDVGFDLLFSAGGKLNSKLQYAIEESSFNIQLNFESFSIQELLPYLQQTLRVGSISGLLDANINISGDLEHIMNSIVHGKASLSSFDLRDDRNYIIMTAKHLTVDMEEVSINDSEYHLNELVAEGVSTMFVMEKDSSNNFTYLMKEAQPESAEKDSIKGEEAAASSIHLSIGKVDLKDIHVAFKDHTLQKPFDYELKQIAVGAENFDLNKRNNIRIHGKMGAAGVTNIQWSGSVYDLSNQDIRLELKNVALDDFTPYSLEYFGYPVSNGYVTFSSHNTISSYNLVGDNNVHINKCVIAPIQKDIKPEMKVPLRMAVYVLKDRNEVIELDLPVKGNIRSPKFSYKKIILAALVNVLVKVSLAPIDLLAGAFGFNAADLKGIEFTNMQVELAPAQYEKLNQLTKIIASKPELVLELKQDINYTEAMNEQAIANLKQDYYLKKHKKTKESLTSSDIADIMKIEDTDSKITEFVNASLTTPVDGDIYQKACVLYQDSINGQVAELATQRNKIIEAYLLTHERLAPQTFKIETVPFVPGKTYSGNSMFVINLTFPGDENPAEALTSTERTDVSQ